MSGFRAAILVGLLAATTRGAPLLDVGADAALSPETTTLASLTRDDGRYAVAVDRSVLAGADVPAVATGDRLTTAFDGENPIIPLPPALVAGLVGLIVVGGSALRRQRAGTANAKIF